MGVRWKPVATVVLLLHIAHSIKDLPDITTEATGEYLENISQYSSDEYNNYCVTDSGEGVVSIDAST